MSFLDKPIFPQQHHVMGQFLCIKLRLHCQFLIRCLVLLCLGFGMFGCGLDETLHRSDKPLSLQSAKKDVWISSLPFPKSTTEIYYLYHAGGMQEYQFLVRFTVSTNDLDEAVNDFLLDHDKTTKERHYYKSCALSGAPKPPSFNEFSPLPWWDPDSITNGDFRGNSEGRQLQVWVDRSKQIIYLCETD